MNIYKFSPSPKTKANAISAIEWQNIFSWWKWPPMRVVICWKIRIFAYWTTPEAMFLPSAIRLWFAEKFVSLLIEQHLIPGYGTYKDSCDLLKNSYLCLLNNTRIPCWPADRTVVICWKIRIFAYWTTPIALNTVYNSPLWFAEKFVSLLIEQHRSVIHW